MTGFVEICAASPPSGAASDSDVWTPAAASVRRPTPRAGAVDLWRVGLCGDAVAIERARASLAADERDRAARYVFERDRRRFILGRAAVRKILGAYLGVAPADVSFETDANGKPFLAAPACSTPPLVFSYSHSEDAGVLGVAASGALGVDYEIVRPSPDLALVAAEQFSADEREALRGLDEARRLGGFFRLWTAKEALTKATGEGLYADFSAISLCADPAGPMEIRAAPPAYAPSKWDLRVFSEQAGTPDRRRRAWIALAWSETCTDLRRLALV